MRVTIKVKDVRDRLQGEIRILEADIKHLYNLNNAFCRDTDKVKENEQYACNLSKIVLGLEKAQDVITKLENR